MGKECWPVFETAYAAQFDLKLRDGDEIPISSEYTVRALSLAVEETRGQVSKGLWLLKKIIGTAGHLYGLKFEIAQIDRLHRQITLSSNDPYGFKIGSASVDLPSEKVIVDFFPKRIDLRVATRDFELYRKRYTADNVNSMFRRMTFAKRAEVAKILLSIVTGEAAESNELNLLRS